MHASAPVLVVCYFFCGVREMSEVGGIKQGFDFVGQRNGHGAVVLERFTIYHFNSIRHVRRIASIWGRRPTTCSYLAPPLRQNENVGYELAGYGLGDIHTP